MVFANAARTAMYLQEEKANNSKQRNCKWVRYLCVARDPFAEGENETIRLQNKNPTNNIHNKPVNQLTN